MAKSSTPVKPKVATTPKHAAKAIDGTPDVPDAKSLPVNISLACFSPKRLNQPEGLAIDKKDTYNVTATKGGMIEVITLDSKRNKANDGYFPFVTGLATDGNGEYRGKDKTGKEYSYKCNDLVELGIGYSFFRRKRVQENCKLQNELFDQKNNRNWGRKCLVVVNKSARTSQQRLTTLARLCDVTKKLNKILRPGSSSSNENQYMVGKDHTPEDVNDGKSLDHYLLDEEVNEIMMNHVHGLGPTWAVDNPEVAHWFLDENRPDYPAFALEIGYVSKGRTPGFNLPEEEDDKCSSETLAKPMSAAELAKYMS